MVKQQASARLSLTRPLICSPELYLLQRQSTHALSLLLTLDSVHLLHQA